MKERNRIWAELYTSAELIKAAKSLIHFGNLHEDLLSDALIKVFESRSDYAELHQRNVLKNYVYITMRDMATKRSARKNPQWWATMDKWAQRYGLAEGKGAITEFIEHESQPEPEKVKADEIEYACKLFSCASEKGILLMRKIEEADKSKETDPEFWESAQYAKLYLEYGSFKKISDATGVNKVNVRQYVNKFKETLSEKKVSISVVTRAAEPVTGMELYRLYYPYFDGLAVSHTGDFDVKHISYEYLDSQPAGALESDVYVFSRVQPELKHIAEKVLSEGKKMVMDCDDYWNLHSDHPLRNSPANAPYVSCVTSMMQKAHMVTTTTETLAERMKIELGVDAVVIKNTIPESAEQFNGDKYPSSLVRFGWIGGLHHQQDVFKLYAGLKKLYQSPDLTGKYQICLGGYNPNPHFKEYEQTMTCDGYAYREDKEYAEYLAMNTNLLDHIGYHKAYRRMWAKQPNKYGEMYREIDVALVPLKGETLFQSCKSELKIIEAGMTKSAAIVTDCMPYSPHLKHEDNCMVVSPTRNNWYEGVRKLINDEDLREELSVNLHAYIKKNFSHVKETNKLATALKKIS